MTTDGKLPDLQDNQAVLASLELMEKEAELQIAFSTAALESLKAICGIAEGNLKQAIDLALLQKSLIAHHKAVLLCSHDISDPKPKEDNNSKT